MSTERWSVDKCKRPGTWGLSVLSAELFCKLKGALQKKNLLIKQTRHEKGGGEEGLTLFLESSPPAFPPLFYLSLFFLTQLVWISSCPPFPSSSHPPASILPRSFSDSAPKTSGTMRSVRYGEKGFFPV